MSNSTIEIKEKTKSNFSLENLEKFVNSDDFEDIVLGYHMIQGETGVTSDFNSFKKELGL